ncbi:hypothetical protein [Salinibacter ruber]|uniref:hypothetical protein n=2 Tax=Salinibacter ruber TaxID=146919 RepID=UPI0020741326|nr:hypothetical protein [Salinibacter ruber]
MRGYVECSDIIIGYTETTFLNFEMGSPIYDFLTESFLFNEENIENRFSRFSNDVLRKELDSYREHALENAPAPSDLGTVDYRVASGTNLVPIDTLTQGAFYVEEVITNDPVFNLTHRPDPVDRATSQTLGFEREADAVDRDRLTSAVRYLKKITPMVAADYVIPLPISYIFEPPSEKPIYAPEDRHAGLLPEDLRDWFWERAQVTSLKKDERGWIDEGNLEISRGIRVDFEGCNFDKSFIYHLQEIVPVEVDEESGKARVRVTIPESLPDKDYFIAWVEQSVNASSYKVLQKIQTEAALAYDCGASYLAPDSFSFSLLQQTVGAEENIPTHTANTVMSFDLPLIQNASIETIMSIRQEEGEAFQSFRTELESLFKELRTIEDESELQKEAENKIHEIKEVEVRNVEQEINSIKRKLPFEATVTALSLASGFVTGGISTVAAIAALTSGAKAGHTLQKHRSEALKHPAYFLWKVQKASQ